MCTFKDFEKLCEDKDIEVMARTVVNTEHRSSLGMKIAPIGWARWHFIKYKKNINPLKMG